MVSIVKLRGEEYFSTRDARVLDALSNLTLVPVCSSRVDVSVSGLERDLNSLLDKTRLGLPGTYTARPSVQGLTPSRMLLTEAQRGHLGTSV